MYSPFELLKFLLEGLFKKRASVGDVLLIYLTLPFALMYIIFSFLIFTIYGLIYIVFCTFQVLQVKFQN